MFNSWSIFTSVYWCWTVLPLFFAILDKFRARLLFVSNISSNIFRCLEGNVCSEGHIFPVSTPFVQKVTAACTFLGTAVGTKIFLQLKLSPSLTLPPLLCFQLPMTFMFNLPDAVLLLFCQPSLQSEDFARLDRKTFVTLAKTVHICILSREMFWEVNISPYGQWLGQTPSIQGTHKMTNVCHRLYCSLNFWPHCEKILYSLYDKF